MSTLSTQSSPFRTMLQLRLDVLRRRLLAIGLGAAATWSILALIAVLIVFAWLDLAVDFNGTVRAIIDLGDLAIALFVGLRLIRWALRSAARSSMARALDSAADAKGQIVAGLDLAASPLSQAHDLTGGLARIAVKNAVNLMDNVSTEAASPATALRKPLGIFAGAVAVFLILCVSMPRMIQCQWLRFADPMGDHPPYSRLVFAVQPGDASVIFGNSVDVQAATSGATAQRMDLVVVPKNSTEQVVPMFPQGDGNWRATIVDVQTPGVYFLRASRARSQKFNLQVITVPQIQNVTFRVALPAYTNRPPYEGPLPQSGLAGLFGTTVTVHAQSNRPLSGGQLTLVASGAVQKIPMTSDGGNQANGEFVINSPGKFELKVTDTDGQMSNDTFGGTITLLKDQSPTVRIVEPYATSFATPDASIKVLAVAEDDYGISKLAIYRNLNDSRFRADDIPVPTPAPTQFPGSMILPLADLGLNPGDTIKVFARTEDNDPAGPKGAESQVATIHIISQAEMDQMQMSRDALAVLESKYAEAARRLESLKNKADQLSKEIGEMDPTKPLTPEQKKALDDLSKELTKTSEEISKLADHNLPIDLDKELSPELRELAANLKDAAETANEATKPGLGAAGALDKLQDIRKQLGEQQNKLNQEATLPLDYLAKIYPLMADQMRFLDLYNHQKDLADRMASLKATTQPDDPLVKARMRDLQDEQHQIRDDLQNLLDDIDNHVAALPADKQLDQLRDTARDFTKAVRASPADQQMTDTVTALDKLDGTVAANGAQSAEDTLNKFIARCNSMGNQGGLCLRFQPKLAAGLGNSLSQMLSLGIGSSGGYSAMANSSQNVGLYGTIPLISARSSGGGGHADSGLATSANGQPDWRQNPDGSGVDGKLQASGAENAPIPPQYKQRVGEYFQRVEDELSQ